MLRIIISIVALIMLTGCMKSVNDAHSQFRGEQENENRLAKMYALSLPACNGKPVKAHKACVSKIRKEYARRFADRFKAHYTASSAESVLATAIVISYAMDSNKSSSSSGSSSSGKVRLCTIHKNNFSFAGLSSPATVVPATCH